MLKTAALAQFVVALVVVNDILSGALYHQHSTRPPLLLVSAGNPYPDLETSTLAHGTQISGSVLMIGKFDWEVDPDSPPGEWHLYATRLRSTTWKESLPQHLLPLQTSQPHLTLCNGDCCYTLLTCYSLQEQHVLHWLQPFSLCHDRPIACTAM